MSASLEDRMKRHAKRMRSAQHRQERAEPGSPAYLCALDDFARNRRMYLELEAQMRRAA